MRSHSHTRFSARAVQRTAMLLTFAVIAVRAHADTLYISDKLVVNVLTEANPESSRVATLDSGDQVESLEKVDAYTRVRLADGREGWIKSSYLVTQAPAVVRLRELEKGRGPTPSDDEAKQLKAQNDALQAELAALKQSAVQQSAPAAAPSVAPPAAETAAALPIRNDPPPLDHDVAYSFHWAHLGIAAALLFVGGLVGFAMGYRTLAGRIRRKYGNVKIY